MSVLAALETMLYCPKCQQTYEDGSQRFCSVEGERLLRAPNSLGKSAFGEGGVFASILNKKTENGAAEKSKPPSLKASDSEPKAAQYSSFAPPAASKIFKPEAEQILEIEPPTEAPSEAPKQAPRVIKPSEIPTSQAGLGDRKIAPVGRDALTPENPEALVGQTVKGRYRVVEKIEQNENAVAFLAEDKLAGDKKVTVKVLLNEDARDEAARKFFAEERVSLSHVNHPNVANVADSGELPEGNPFIVTEFVEGKSVKDLLDEKGQFNAQRTARVIRQAAYALDAVHAVGVVHRNLTPENVILIVSDGGAEQVKLTNFGVSKGELNKQNVLYKSPETFERKRSNAAGDIYSLAVVAYQMLTNRLPFKASSKKDFLKAQHEGFVLRPTDLRFDLPPQTDEVLEKALAFEPEARFAKARDFGDALFDALTANETVEEKSEETTSEQIEQTEEISSFVPPVKNFDFRKNDSETEIAPSAALEEKNEKTADAEIKTTKDLPWEKRSPEPPVVATRGWNALSFLGVALLLAGLFGVWYYFINRAGESVQPAVENAAPVQQNAVNTTAPNQTPAASEEIEVPPLPRAISQPPDTIFFENSRQTAKGALLKNFLGFSLYYPKDWTRNESENKFLDVAKKSPAGLPVEQMLVSFYESNGTFQADREIFPKLIENSNQDLKKIIPNYQTLSEGETKINGGWKAFEVKFQGGGAAAGKADNKLILWGRRLWIPAARPGAKSGYVITMLATSLSPDVRSVDDVGVKGELATVLETFEPNQNF